MPESACQSQHPPLHQIFTSNLGDTDYIILQKKVVATLTTPEMHQEAQQCRGKHALHAMQSSKQGPQGASAICHQMSLWCSNTSASDVKQRVGERMLPNALHSSKCRDRRLCKMDAACLHCFMLWPSLHTALLPVERARDGSRKYEGWGAPW